MDLLDALILIALAVFTAGYLFRERLRPVFNRIRKPAAESPAPAANTTAAPVNMTAAAQPGAGAALTARLYELDKVFGPFGSNAAHPSDLYSLPQFVEAVGLLAAPDLPFGVVLQYVEGNSWSLCSAALAALRRRSDRGEAISRVLTQCANFSPWAMFFALQVVFEAEPRVDLGEPVARAKDWWAENRWMPNIFRDYFVDCAHRGDAATFGSALTAPGSSPHGFIKDFLQRVMHPFATALIKEIDDWATDMSTPSAPAAPSDATLRAVGRFWRDMDHGILVAPGAWREPMRLAALALRQRPPRSLLVSGEPLVGKSSFLQSLSIEIASDDWRVFEASGADLQADQIYIGQLEGRIRQLIAELAKGHRLIWYIPDIVQVAMSGRHQGQSATMLDQIVPGIAAGQLVIWCEATPKGAARLMQIKPSLRGLFETVTLEAMSSADALRLARDVVAEMAERTDIRLHPACAEVALATASQYLGTGGLPGSALLMLKLTAARAERKSGEIAPRQVLETLAQLTGLPLSILDTKQQLDLRAVREFFTARVIGQDEAIAAVIERVAMLKAGLNDPDKPIGVFLFAGPTGTGKTELAKAVSEFLFGAAERMIRLDMSEFQTVDSLTKILGQNSMGVIEPDSLVARVRKQPFSVVLLDEFEKSHPMVWDLFLQAFDEGRLTDAMGQTADLRHCLIILTTNLGATAHRSLGLGFAPQADVFTKDQVLKAISQTYRPEFQNRLDKVIVFRPLTRELMRGILKKELAALLDRRGLKDRTWAIEWESSALEFLLERGFSAEMGARPLKRAIDQYVVAPLAAIIVEQRFPQGEQFLFVRSDGNGIQAEFVDPDADTASAGEGAPAAAAGSAAPPALASVILGPRGTRAEFDMLKGEYEKLERILSSAKWVELKSELMDEMSAPDFWHRPERFGPLARFALMDRVKAAAETADALCLRLERYTRSPRHSAELSGRLALQLHLIGEGVADALEDAPVEAALAVEPVLDGAGTRQETLAWCDRLLAMYRAWAGKRRMQISALPAAGKDKGTAVLSVSGFGAYRALAAESGLHVLEAPEHATGRVTARVCVAALPPGERPAAKERRLIQEALGSAARSSAVVRRYREEPPLVRDAAGKWRTGRLDLVLGGEFDLLQSSER